MTTTFQDNIENIETNLRYLIELDLSDEESQGDKLAMAFYYHFITKNKAQSININTLIGWARSYCYETLAKEHVSKKRDTEVTAAMLAYVSLKKDKGFAKEKKKEIENNIPNVLKKALKKDNLFFQRPNFTAIILYASKNIGVEVPREDDVVKTLMEKYAGQRGLTNISGLPFFTAYLLIARRMEEAEEIIGLCGEKIGSHALEYDDALYAAHSLYQYHHDQNTALKVFDYVKKTIENTPIMLSDIINKGDISDITVRTENRKISRLYKAALLDLLERLKKNLHALQEKKLDQKYSSESSYKVAAFAAYSSLCILPAIIWGYLSKASIASAFSFWIMQKTETTWKALIANTSATIAEAYLVLFAIIGMYALFKIIIKEKLTKDTRIKEKFWQYQKKAGKWFVISLLGVLVLGVIEQLITGSFQKFLTKN